MKLFLLSAIIFVTFFCGSANAQWIRDSTIFGNAIIYHNGYDFIGKDGVSRSTNNGQNWNRQDTGFSNLGTERVVNCFLSTGNVLIAGANVKSIYKTTDNGLNWTVSSAGLVSGFSTYCMMKKDSIIYAGGDDGVYYSTNNGTSWQVTSPQLYSKNVIAMCYIGNRLIASVAPKGSIQEGIYISSNNGANWFRSSNGLDSFATLYGITVHRNNLLFACSTDAKIYKSTNQGTTWLHVSTNGVIDPFYNPIYAISSFNLSLVVGCNNGIYMSTNAGVNWFNFSFGIPPGSQFQKNQIVQCGPYIFALANNGTYRIPSGLIGIQQISSVAPEKYELKQNYPNPFNPTTKINFTIPVSSFAQLKIYDINGRELKDLFTGNISAGAYSVDFDGSNFSTGIYFYTLKVSSGTDQQIITRKMLLVK